MIQSVKLCKMRKKCEKRGRMGNVTQTWRLSGDDRQGTPPRTISASIAKIPSRKHRCWESEVADAVNCLFSGLLLKHLHFHTKWLATSKGGGNWARTHFFFLRAFCCCVDNMIKVKLWIMYRIWWILLFRVSSRVVSNLSPRPQALSQPAAVRLCSLPIQECLFFRNQQKLLISLCAPYSNMLSLIIIVI